MSRKVVRLKSPKRHAVKGIVRKLTLLLEPQEEGGWLVTSPDLPELITEIESLEDLPEVLEDALTAVLELYEDFKKPLPEKLRASEILA